MGKTMGKKNGDPPPKRSYEPLSPEEFKRLVAEAQKRGESTTPLVKRLVLTTIDDVAARLKEDDPAD